MEPLAPAALGRRQRERADVAAGVALLGYLVIGDIPDFLTWVGAGVIVCSGLYLGHQERLRYLAMIRPNKN